MPTRPTAYIQDHDHGGVAGLSHIMYLHLSIYIYIYIYVCVHLYINMNI